MVFKIKKFEYFHSKLIEKSWLNSDDKFKKYFETFFEVPRIIDALSIELDNEKIFFILEEFIDYRIIFIDEYQEKNILFDKLDLDLAKKKFELLKTK